MEGPPLGAGGEDIPQPDHVAPRGRKASSNRKIKPQTATLKGTLPLSPTKRNYATLGLVAAVHTTPTGDDHAGGRPVEVARQEPTPK